MQSFEMPVTGHVGECGLTCHRTSPRMQLTGTASSPSETAITHIYRLGSCSFVLRRLEPSLSRHSCIWSHHRVYQIWRTGHAQKETAELLVCLTFVRLHQFLHHWGAVIFRSTVGPSPLFPCKRQRDVSCESTETSSAICKTQRLPEVLP